MSQLSHFDDSGAARMVDVAGKEVTFRQARAGGTVTMRTETLDLIRDKKVAKGDVFEVARLAGIMAVKRTADLIPLCHPIGIDKVQCLLAALNETVSDDRFASPPFGTVSAS